MEVPARDEIHFQIKYSVVFPVLVTVLPTGYFATLLRR